jgi:predicted membrane protein
MAGVELNFSEAGILTSAQLEINAVLGGIKIILPSNWEIRSEINCVMGGVDDKRHIRQTEGEDKKLLILEGNVFLGGIEIKNY